MITEIKFNIFFARMLLQQIEISQHKKTTKTHTHKKQNKINKKNKKTKMKVFILFGLGISEKAMLSAASNRF